MEVNAEVEVLMTSTPKPPEAAGASQSDNNDTQVSVNLGNQPGVSIVPKNTDFGFVADSVAMDESTENSEIVKDRAEFKNQFTSLNNRFVAYVHKVKTIDKKLEESEKVRKDIEEQMSQLRTETTQQVNMLRNEIEWHVKQAVQADETITQLQKTIEESKLENRALRTDLEQKRQRETSLERTLVSERNTIRALREENNKLREQRKKDEKDRVDLCSQVTRLKVDVATLHERVKITNFERTMLESKIVEVDKKLQFSAEDVDKKVATERNRLEKLGFEKLEEYRSKHQADMERLKKEHNKKMQDTLLTYVSAEEHARLETRHQQALKRAQDVETILAERQELIKRLRAEIEDVKAIKNKECAAERRRRDRLNKRLIVQKQSYDDIRQELETYRQLIDSLDLDTETLANTPLGAKRPRISIDAPSRLNETYSKSKVSESPSASLRARQMLVRRALTPKKAPRRRTSAAGPSNENDNEDIKPDCKVM